MRSQIARSVAVALLLAGSIVTAAAQQGTPARVPLRMKLKSPDFTEGSLIPKSFTCSAEGGTGVSPRLQWTNIPKGTASFALTLTNTDNHPAKGMDEEIAWILWNVPGSTTELEQGVPGGYDLPDGSHQARSGRPIAGYRPPCPPPGTGPIHYVFTLYALDQMLTLPPEATRAEFMKALDGHVVGSTIYVGMFER